MTFDYDVVIIGAGAAGLMCAIEAGKRGRRVLVLDHAKKLAEKIRISGGGRCNFTNLYADAEKFLSQNPHFCKSALRQYSQHDFINLLHAHRIGFHEKKLGQLFCDNSSQDIITMLQTECASARANIRLDQHIEDIQRMDTGFVVAGNFTKITSESVVIATGGLSIPKIGATGFGYEIAQKFGLTIVPTRPGLVPLTFDAEMLTRCKSLSGLSVEVTVHCQRTEFAEGLLFTHRGLSGPSILQISSYWHDAMPVTVNLAPGTDIAAALKAGKRQHPKQDVVTCLSHYLPKRLATNICEQAGMDSQLAAHNDNRLGQLGAAVNGWQLVPAGTEGYRTAEVTLGGVDTADLSSSTMQAKHVPGLYFIGEVVDVTGHLGGYNFQWAWSSGFVAGQHV
ncbi:MAG: NAD(P)/FAD-dependent oxidoreductase [Proteobacteria bacterium]|nr:NAD(P)/FAD-dependent oxidoreductase [Pseudomonadota bacterium]MDA0845982.1 NAD(P)/FAD-dependent oxidoreductase [Pseudomonadota bacterium]